jgi:hypothetical protein
MASTLEAFGLLTFSRSLSYSFSRSGHFSRSRINANFLAILTLALECDDTINECIERIITAPSHIHAGVELRSALPHQDVASPNRLATIALNAKPLSI